MERLYEFYLKNPVVCTDSRRIRPGCIFFALKGARFDGNRYALQALEEGASLAVVDDPDLPQHPGCYRVADALKALQDLARHHRRRFDIPVLAITGSNGKTTTKELLAAVLARRFKLHYTQGNFNNHIGLPLTILSMPADTDFLLLEMGANHPGEIDALCRIAEPTHGLITNVGMAHLEGFGSFEGVRRTKAELYRFLQETRGIVFLNANEPYLKEEMLPPDVRCFTYGSEQAGEVDYPVEQLANEGAVHLAFEQNGQRFEARLQLSGKHNFQNAMTAVAVGLYFDVAPQAIVQALEAYRPGMNRSEWVERAGLRYMLDAYNANPSSMRLALEDFAAQAAAGKRIAVLGEMRELGTYAEKAHEEVLSYARSLPLDEVWCVGEGFRQTAQKTGIRWFENTDALKNWLNKNPLPAGTQVFLKGSRGVALEQLLDA